MTSSGCRCAIAVVCVTQVKESPSYSTLHFEFNQKDAEMLNLMRMSELRICIYFICEGFQNSDTVPPHKVLRTLPLKSRSNVGFTLGYSCLA